LLIATPVLTGWGITLEIGPNQKRGLDNLAQEPVRQKKVMAAVVNDDDAAATKLSLDVGQCNGLV